MKNKKYSNKLSRYIKEEADVPLNRAAINKILMAVAQAGSGSVSPQQQQTPAADRSQKPTAQDDRDTAQSVSEPKQGKSQAQATPSASSRGYDGPDVPLNKAAINKILMSVAQAGA